MTEWPPVHQLGDASGQTTRDRIIDAALYLFWLRGYAATGIAEILERAEANAGSFYHFFKAKGCHWRCSICTRARSCLLLSRPVLGEIEDPIERVFGILAFYRT